MRYTHDMELTAPLTDVPRARMAVASAVRTGDIGGERRARAILAASVVVDRLRRTLAEYADDLAGVDDDVMTALNGDLVDSLEGVGG